VFKRLFSSVTAIIIGLVFLLVISVLLLISDFGLLRRQGLMNPRHYQIFLRGARATTSTVPLIAPWMTFSYLNQVFNLPPAYLRGALQIDDANYPRLTINHYVREKRQPPDVFLEAVKQAIAKRLAGSVTTSAH